MPVIALINRKGGSGKSTIATHLAAYAANSGIPTMLGDIDRQQSSKTWLALRNAVQEGNRPPIMTWAVDVGGSLHPPASVQWIVLDTPGGLYGLELAKVVMAADVVIMPVCNSLFDRESAAMCIEELKRLPRVKSGKCKVGIVGMRIDSRTQGANDISQWADKQGIEYIAHLRDVSMYVRCAEMGLTIFDLDESKCRFDRLQWLPILDWLKPQLNTAKTAMMQHPTYVQAAKSSPTQAPAATGVPAVTAAANSPIETNTAATPITPTVGHTVSFEMIDTPIQRKELRPGIPKPVIKKSLFTSIQIPAFLLPKK